MAKALKPLVIVLLILSIVSLVLGSILFSQREVLKGRTLKHEAALASIASKLHVDAPNAELLKDYAKMQQPLDQLAVAAEVQYEDLQNTKADLENTRADLAKTREELSATKTELAAAQSKITELNDSLEKKEIELAEQKSKVDQLEQDKASLQIQIDDLNSQMVKSEEEMRDLQDQVATLEKIIKDMEGERGGKKLLPTGLTGRILAVNPDWNFVVLDIGSDVGVVPSAELIIHRNDQLVGKLRVSSVQKNMSIAEVMSDWAQENVHEGDYVFF